MKITAAVLHEKNGPFCFEEVDLAEPKDHELLVKMVASGICHTDAVARSQDIPVKLPAVLGHEGAGIVEKVGAKVHGIEVGDHVAFSYAFCDHCKNCAVGEPYNCENSNAINFGGVASDGTTRLSQNGEPVSMFFGQSSFATHCVVNSKSAVKVDKDIDLGILAPLGCGVQTGAGTVLNSIKPRPSSSIAVFGCGAVGMSAIMAANVARCKIIIAVGGNEKSLQMAKEFGATHTVNRKKVDDIPAEIQRISDGGLDFAVDTTGHGPLIDTAIKCLAYKGKIAVLGASGIIENFDVGNQLLVQNRSMNAVIQGASVSKIFIPEIIQYYKRGEFPIDKIVTFYDFKDIDKAFEDSGSGKVIKAVIRM